MASEHLKGLRSIWGDSCHGMWAELLCITMAESHVVANYRSFSDDVSIQDCFHAPELKGRINALTRDAFLLRTPGYRQAVVTNRVVILSAAFESYFISFLDAYIASRQKFNDPATGKTAAGNKLYGDVLKARGLVPRILTFSELTGSGIKTIEPKLTYLNDVYLLRNVLAHGAGEVDKYTSSTLSNVQFDPGRQIVLSADDLITLAKPVMEIAEFLDRKIISEFDASTGKHRPEVVAAAARKNPPRPRPEKRNPTA